ncbi:MAG: hypothetical protein HY720_09075 [Planctomycetes bacterium]|nr:hypothetical protein [Planctomycetota bacterium]
MDKFSWWKKVLVIVVLVVAVIPPLSLTEWACDTYYCWARKHTDSGFATWLFYTVGRIHDFMGRDDKAVMVYGDFYETYKAPSMADVESEDERVAKARYRLAMALYDRDRKSDVDWEAAHRCLHYFAVKYAGTTRADNEDVRKAQEYKVQCEIDGKEYGYPKLNQNVYPPEYSPAYEPFGSALPSPCD